MFARKMLMATVCVLVIKLISSQHPYTPHYKEKNTCYYGNGYKMIELWLLVLLLQHCVFFSIGRGGQRIRELEDASGARIKVHIA